MKRKLHYSMLIKNKIKFFIAEGLCSSQDNVEQQENYICNLLFVVLVIGKRQ